MCPTTAFEIPGVENSVRRIYKIPSKRSCVERSLQGKSVDRKKPAIINKCRQIIRL